MKSTEFREELVKIMPGYEWTVNRTPGTYLRAIGIQSSGFNRLSTLQVKRREENGAVEYAVKSSGFGKSAPWLSTAKRETLAQALRALQDYYEHTASNYRSHASYLQGARKQ